MQELSKNKRRRTASIPSSKAQTKAWITKLSLLYAGRAEKATFHQERPILRLYLEKLREVLNHKLGSGFELREPFKVGRTGILFRAVDWNVPGELALKFNRYLPVESYSMVENERQVLPYLRHPNIIRIIDGGATQVETNLILSYLIEPLVPDALPLGRYVECSLANHGVSRHVALGEALRSLIHLLYQWVDALNYIHHQGFTYLDVKPDNAIVDKKGHLTIIDFGSAKCYNRNGMRSRSEAKRDPMKGLADSFYSSEPCTRLLELSREEKSTSIFFTKRYAHPYLRKLRTRSTAIRPAARIERRFLHPRFDYYSLGKSILELLNTIARQNPNDCSRSSLFQSLHFLGTRLLDGCNELSGDPDIVSEIWGGLEQSDYASLRYRDLETVLEDLESEVEV